MAQAKGVSGVKLIMGIVLLMMAVFVLPTLLIFAIGMLPTVIAYMIDRRKEKYAAFCVGCMNFAGVLPYGMRLWVSEHSVEGSMRQVADPVALLVMVGAAAVGWVIYFVAPSIVGVFLRLQAEQKVRRLKELQRELMEEWGEDIARSHAADAPRNAEESPA